MARHKQPVRSSKKPTATPIAAVVCCSDCRPAPEVIFDQPRDAIITIQNAGPIATDGVVASVEEAVSVAGAPLVVVLAHDNCPLIRRLCSSRRSEVPRSMLDFYDEIIAVVGSDATPATAEVVGRLALDNARKQAAVLVAKSRPLNDGIDSGTVRLQVALFSSATGEVTFSDWR